MPKVSAIIPYIAAEIYLSEAIECIQAQTLEDWELIIPVKDDDSEVVKQLLGEYSEKDNRIRILTADDEDDSLSACLNLAIEASSGEYIAIVDVIDSSYPNRFEKQSEYLDASPDIFLCGTQQRTITPLQVKIELYPCENDQIKASLLFDNLIVFGSTVFRRMEFITNQWWFQADCADPYYDFLIRTAPHTATVNLPNILIDHREFPNDAETMHPLPSNLTVQFLDLLGIDHTQYDAAYIRAWDDIPYRLASKNPEKFLDEGYCFLRLIEEANQEIGLLDHQALHSVLCRRWMDWICVAGNTDPGSYTDRHFVEERKSGEIDDLTVFDSADLMIAAPTTQTEQPRSAPAEDFDELPLVSVVMPVYNGARFLQEALDSIFSQTYHNWECIVVLEYGNADNSDEIVSLAAGRDDRIIVIQNSEKLGISESLNVGIRRAGGKYIARMDADDISMPDRIRQQVLFMEDHPHCGVVGCRVGSIGTEALTHQIETNQDVLAGDLLFESPCVHPAVLMRSSTLKDNRIFYDPEIICNEDYHLFSRIAMVAEIANLDQELLQYRMTNVNAFFRNSHKGAKVYLEVMSTQLQRISVTLPDCDLRLLSPLHFYSEASTQPVKSLMRLDLLLKKLFISNEQHKCFDRYAFFITLSKQFRRAYKQLHSGAANTDYKSKLEQIYNFSIFKRKCFYKPKCSFDQVDHPVISIILPTYNSEKYIFDTVWSLLEQTFTDFELLVINECGSDDSTVQMLDMFEDKRIRIIQNTEKLGLAKSLNLGMVSAKGDFIARADADDIYPNNRLQKQYAFFCAHPDIDICGSWQHHFGVNQDFIHRVPTSHDDLRARFIYNCEMCHSTVMMRKDRMLDNQLFYNPDILAEDFELWGRAADLVRFANIPEILGFYRLSEDNITTQKMQNISVESGEIAAKNIESHLGVAIPKAHIPYMGGWNSPSSRVKSKRAYRRVLETEKSILRKMWASNAENLVYNPDSLLKTINYRWKWFTDSMAYGSETEILTIEELLSDQYMASASHGGLLKRILKKILRPILLPFKQRVLAPLHFLRQQIWDLDGHMKEHVKNLEERMDWRIWQAEKIMMQTLDSRIWQAENTIRSDLQSQVEGPIHDNINQILLANNARVKYIPCLPGEKIRIVFLFQIASFWPSWDTLWESCQNDPRIDAKMVLFDKPVKEFAQIETAEDFLIANNIPYEHFENFDMDGWGPHIVIYQTPYDSTHRPQYLWAPVSRAKGWRLAYISYGIEISNTAKAQADHFKRTLPQNAWRIYTFSGYSRAEYLSYISPNVVKALGHPKFDRLYSKDGIDTDPEILERAAGRKIVLWKVHFPFTRYHKGRKQLVTPSLEMYLEFAKMIPSYSDMFFIFMPHPKFLQMSEYLDDKGELAKEIMSVMAGHDNVFTYTEDDYRQAIIYSDYVIVDRSAVMIEAGTLGAPVLYISNSQYYEPLNPAIAPIIDSYYKGIILSDIIRFLEMCRKEQDPKRRERMFAIEEYIPYFDGNAGERIKDDLIQGVVAESKAVTEGRRGSLNAHIATDGGDCR